MTLQQLIYFRTIAGEQSFTRAAESLNITQPNLSHAIHQLEAELKVQLFVRQGRIVTLSHYGKLYLEYVTHALNQLEQGRIDLEKITEPGKGTVLLSYLSSLSEYIPYLASRFMIANPSLHPYFRMSQRPHGAVCRDVFDLACNLGFTSLPDQGSLETHFLGSHRSVVIVSDRHPFASRSSISLNELDGQNFVAYTQDCRIRHLIDQLLEQHNVKPVIVSELLYDNLLFGMVNANFGIAIVPEPMGMQLRNIHVLSIEESEARRDIYMIWSRDNYLPEIAARFRDFIISQDLSLDRFRETISGQGDTN